MSNITAIIELKGDTDQAVRAINRADREVSQLNKKLQTSSSRADRANRSFYRLSRTANNMAFVLKGIAIAAFAKGIHDATMSAIDWDSALIKVGKTTDITGARLKAFGGDLIEISSTLGISKVELAGIAEIAGQLGVKGVDNLSAFTETVAKLTRATNLGAEQASFSLARVLALTGEDISANVERLGSSYVFLGNNLATTEVEISAVTEKMAALAPVFELASHEILGISAAFSSVGVEGDAATTAMNKFFVALEKIKAGRNNQGLSAIASLLGQDESVILDRLKNNNLSTSAGQILGGLSNLDPIGQRDVLASLGLSNDRVVKSLSAVIGDAFLEAVNSSRSAFEDNTALEKETQTHLQSLSGEFKTTWESLKNNLTDMSTSIASTVLPLLKLADAATAAANKFYSFYLTSSGDEKLTLLKNSSDPKVQKLYGETLAKYPVDENTPEDIKMLIANLIQDKSKTAGLQSVHDSVYKNPNIARQLMDFLVIGKLTRPISNPFDDELLNFHKGLVQEQENTLSNYFQQANRFVPPATETTPTAKDTTPVKTATELEQENIDFLKTLHRWHVAMRPVVNAFEEEAKRVEEANDRLAQVESQFGYSRSGFTTPRGTDIAFQGEEDTNPMTVDEMITETRRLQGELMGLELERLNETKAAWKSTADNITGEFENIIKDSKSFAEGIKDIFDHVWRDLANKMLAEPLSDFISGTLASAFAGIPGLATGGSVIRGGNVLVGERGAEVVKLPAGSKVLPNHMMNDFGGGTTFNISVNGVQDPLTVKKAVGDMLPQIERQMKTSLVRDLQSNSQFRKAVR